MRFLLVVPLVAVALILSGCIEIGSSNDPQNDAFHFCSDQVATTFDDPDGAEFSQWSGGRTSQDHYEFDATVTADGSDFDLTCTVSGTYGHFTLDAYNLTPAG